MLTGPSKLPDVLNVLINDVIILALVSYAFSISLAKNFASKVRYVRFPDGLNACAPECLIACCVSSLATSWTETRNFVLLASSISLPRAIHLPVVLPAPPPWQVYVAYPPASSPLPQRWQNYFTNHFLMLPRPVWLLFAEHVIYNSIGTYDIFLG